MQDSKWLTRILSIGRKIIPHSIFKAAQPTYHYILALIGAVVYRFPSKKIVVIAVTGTKGKSTTTELVNAILEAAQTKTALLNTIRFKIDDLSKPNKFKMTLPGRFFLQKFLRQAVDRGCTHAVIEMSSEAVPQFRHKFIYLDALIFTNLAPEHIESHGSYDNYVRAKIEIAKILETTPKSNPALVVNVDDKESEKFLSLNIKNKISYSVADAFNIHSDQNGSSFQIEKTVIHSRLPGIFNVSNMLGAIALTRFLGIGDEIIKNGLESIEFIRGRMEKVDLGQNFDAVVDYAHTPESLRAIYQTYSGATLSQATKLICVLGNTGGGRDKWKRSEMGKIADQYCSQIILTNEDPYDEDPLSILNEMKSGIKNTPCEVILDRRNAIFSALNKAKEWKGQDQKDVAVLITGKGTDPYIMGPNGTKLEWDDASVTREELQKII